MTMTWALFEQTMTDYLMGAKPFLFVIDFDCQKPFICPLADAEKHRVFYDVKGRSNFSDNSHLTSEITKRPQIEPLNPKWVNKAVFSTAFQQVQAHINLGDSYLLNLTFPTELDNHLDLLAIFAEAQAPYKLFYHRDDAQFVVFSPESFLTVRDGFIYTYPMKGTIDATLPNAEQQLLDNRKEQWEHNTVVDLLRNDLSQLASEVTVTRYRYIDKIKTHRGEILQTSSEIRGKLPPQWQSRFARQLRQLLPAGSITGAPRQKTLDIIKANEIAERGYYTGIFGIFDGEQLDSAVMIRFIERQGDKLLFKSGGGITAYSDQEKEYAELQQKVYIPTV